MTKYTDLADAAYQEMRERELELCGYVCGIPRGDHQTEEHPFAARAPLDVLLDASLRMLEHWDAPTTGEHPDDDECVPRFERATMDARQAHAAALSTEPES